MYVTDQNLARLRTAIELQMGHPILSFPDCNALSEDISAKFHATINQQTLRRLFGPIRYNGGFSRHTLDLLANYCGHASYIAFSNSFIENDLDKFFAEINDVNAGKDYWELSSQLSRRVIDDPSLLVSVHHELMPYPMARYFFIENHPLRDLMCTVYAQYFQEYLKYKHSNEALLFAYGFLFMGAFLSGNREFADIYFRRIQETEITPEVFVLPAARKFGVTLLYAWMTENEKLFRETWHQMLEARPHYFKGSENSACSFEYAVLEHLIFTDRTDEMLYLIQHNTQQKNEVAFLPQDRKECHQQVWNILCAFVYAKCEDSQNAKKYLALTEIAKLSVGWEKFYTIIYLLVKLKYADHSDMNKISTEVQRLLSETHFTYYNDFMPEFLAEKTLKVI